MSTSEQRKAENQKYIKETVDVHINQLLLDILIEKPDDVLKYMAEWVYLKQNPDFKKNLKKELRQAAHSVEKEEGKAQHYEPKFTPSHVHSAVPEQELAKHHKKHSEKHEEDEDEEVPEEAEEEAEVFPFDCQDGYEKPHLNSDEEDEDEEADEVADLDTMLKQKQSQMASSGGVVKVRSSVSAEAFGVFNKKADFKARVIPKTPEQKEKIKAKLMNSFMFKALDEKDFETCIMAMEIKTYNQGDYIIKQGDDGAELYIVESGQQNCYIKFPKSSEPALVTTYKPGSSFGELSLLYNVPRAATIIANEESILYALDRACFNAIVKEASVKRRERFEAFINKVSLLSTLDTYEKNNFCDVLEPETFEEGAIVVKQGDPGTRFYFIEEGNAVASKNLNGQEEVVFEYKENDYFGEIALLKDEPRAATIKAVNGRLKVCSIERDAFKRLLGPLDELLKRNMSKYESYIKK